MQSRLDGRGWRLKSNKLRKLTGRCSATLALVVSGVHRVKTSRRTSRWETQEGRIVLVPMTPATCRVFSEPQAQDKTEAANIHVGDGACQNPNLPSPGA